MTSWTGSSPSSASESEMQEESFRSTLTHLCREHGIFLSQEQSRWIFQHVELMLEWNRQVNLTRITNIQDILIEHVLDSLLPARWLPPQGSILDVGSGPGFPGIPLKILFPHRTVVLIESNRKKASFLRVLISRLEMKSLSVVQGRWEEWEKLPCPDIPKRYEMVVLRSVRLDPDFLGLHAWRSLNPGGTLACWSGELNFEHQTLGRSTEGEGFMLFRRKYSYTLPGLRKSRCLWLWEKGN